MGHANAPSACFLLPHRRQRRDSVKPVAREKLGPTSVYLQETSDLAQPHTRASPNHDQRDEVNN